MKCAKRKIKKDNSMTYFSLVFCVLGTSLKKFMEYVEHISKEFFFLQIRFCTLSFYDDH